MNNCFKRITKLLCCFIISLFIIGIGGEVAKAETFHKDGGRLSYRQGNGYFYFKDSSGNVAYCLNSKLEAPTANLPEFPLNVSDATKRSIAAVMAAKDSLSFSSDKDKKSFYVTQAYIWWILADYNMDNVSTGGEGDPFTKNFVKWLTESGPSEYKTAWGVLQQADEDSKDETNYSISLSTSSSKLTSDGNGNLKSSQVTLNANGYTGNFNVSIKEGSTEGACIDYNGTCSTETVSIPKGAKFYVSVPTPSDPSGEVKVDISVSNATAGSTYNIKTYGYADPVAAGFQNIAVLVTEPKNDTITYGFYGDFVNSFDVPVQKLDSKTNQKVAGAVLQIKRVSDNAVVATVDSTGEGEDNPIVTLPVGEYRLVEFKAPNGYILNGSSVPFSIVDESGTLKLKQDGNDVATISLSDEPVKIKFIKTDEEGNPVAGVKFIIKSSSMYGACGDDACVKKASICAITDSNGVLSQPCTGEDGAIYGEAKSDGIYQLGADFGQFDYYKVWEKLDSNSKFSNRFPENNITFRISDDSSVKVFNPAVTYTKDSGTGVFTFKLHNSYYLNISKTDVTGGSEIAGAKLVIKDPSVVLNPNTETGNDNIVDEWTSVAGQTHTFNGIIPNHIYELNETIAPAGYVSVSTSIFFSMDENGKVKTYEDATGAKEIDMKEVIASDDNPYKMLVTNDVTKVYFKKTDAVTGEEVEGAELKICTAASYEENKNDCDAVTTWPSGKEETLIEMLPIGDYVLIETLAPAGYVRQTNAVSFSVTGEGVGQVEFKNEPTKVIIKKLDQVTKERVAGAKLQILDAETKEVAKTASGVELVWVSEVDKDWEIYALPAGKYILVETAVPQNYQEGMIIDGIVTAEYEFTVSDQEGDINIEVGIEVLNAPNTGISTLNLFAIGGLMVFVGYETIKIYRRKTING